MQKMYNTSLDYRYNYTELLALCSRNDEIAIYLLAPSLLYFIKARDYFGEEK